VSVRGFGARLGDAFEAYGRLCVGIDPHAFLLEKWGLADDAAGAREFGLRVVAATSGVVGIVKPQVAFFERFGSAGYAALEDVLAAARAAGLLVIADVKRGDVGSSVEAYGQAWLTPGSPLEADAITASAFQGFGSLEAPLRLADSAGKGLFVLAATSNPEAADIQLARVPDEDGSSRSVARVIIDDVTRYNEEHARATIASVGVVLGATLTLTDYGIDTPGTPAYATAPTLPVLAPGFGHQGARLGDATRIYGGLAAGVIVSESRSVLAAGPAGIADAIAHRAREVRAALA
jgi:orotidine 5''-phosphate decarboxylase, subfamily 2